MEFETLLVLFVLLIGAIALNIDIIKSDMSTLINQHGDDNAGE